MIKQLKIGFMNLAGLLLLILGCFGVYLYTQGRFFTLFQMSCGLACFAAGPLCFQYARKIRFKSNWMRERMSMDVEAPIHWRVLRGLEQRIEHRENLYIDRRREQILKKREERRIQIRRQRTNYVPQAVLAFLGGFLILLGSGILPKDFHSGDISVAKIEGWVKQKTSTGSRYPSQVSK